MILYHIMIMKCVTLVITFCFVSSWLLPFVSTPDNKVGRCSKAVDIKFDNEPGRELPNTDYNLTMYIWVLLHVTPTALRSDPGE